MERFFAAVGVSLLAACIGVTVHVAAHEGYATDADSAQPQVRQDSPSHAATATEIYSQEPPANIKAMMKEPVSSTPELVIDAPVKGTIYPPDMTPPTFAWRDDNPLSKYWRIEILSSDQSKSVRVWVQAERRKLGQLDTSLSGYVPPTLSPKEAAQYIWQPDEKTWDKIKKLSTDAPASLFITGYTTKYESHPLFHAESDFSTSVDNVGAPIFYRDVPLIPPPPESEQRGVIKPLPDSVLPKIRWQLRYVNETHPHLMMSGLPTCANCHSFSADGKTLGIDVDGPQNDKGLYAMVPIHKTTSISNDYVLRWSSFSEERAQKRFGFMSQVSPFGQYVITSIDVPHSNGPRQVDRIYTGFYSFYGFGQVFFSTRGVLAWYSKETGKLQTLPGADDPEYVQTGAFWSPDGKYLIYSRAKATDPYPPGKKLASYANDPNETQIQYDLYRIPFNNGKGGTPERVVGASENGMSNSFPKVSPDGKWIIWVQSKNGLLMRPDSKLWIVPFEGGVARPLASNLPVMNSWHSFSPNGKWLVFSSKSPSFYTRLYLTHIDEEGNASPAVPIEDSTDSNRAANIPEFVHLGPEGMDHIETPAIDFYKAFDAAAQFADLHNYNEAIPAWRKAIDMTPDDSRAHNNLGVALAAVGQTQQAISEYKRSLELNAESSQTQNNLGSVLAESGQIKEAMEHIEKAIELNPDNAQAHINKGHLLENMGGHRDEAIVELKKGLELAPKSSEGHNIYGVLLARMGNMKDAVDELQLSVDLAPQCSDCQFNLGRALAATNKFSAALQHLQTAAKLSNNKEPNILQMLAGVYSDSGQNQQALDTAQQAMMIAIQQNNQELINSLRANITRYRQLAGLPPQ